MDILALLFPREKKFYKMIEEQVKLVNTGVADFTKLINNYKKLTPTKRSKLIHEICHKEKQDDVLYTDMVRALKSTFITPMDREDIHQLVATFDTIIDTLELLALKLTAYRMRSIDKYLKEQTDIFSQSFSYIEKIIFSMRREEQVEKYCLAIRALEQRADKVYIKAVGVIFADSVGPKDIIKLQDLYSSLENLIDKINDAAMIIENIVVKYS